MSLFNTGRRRRTAEVHDYTVQTIQYNINRYTYVCTLYLKMKHCQNILCYNNVIN